MAQLTIALQEHSDSDFSHQCSLSVKVKLKPASTPVVRGKDCQQPAISNIVGFRRVTLQSPPTIMLISVVLIIYSWVLFKHQSNKQIDK